MVEWIAVALIWFTLAGLFSFFWDRPRKAIGDVPESNREEPLQTPVKYASPQKKKPQTSGKSWGNILKDARKEPEKKEQYRVLDVRVFEEPTNHQYLLNEMSELGWELVSAVPITSTTPEVRYIFRRKGLFGDPDMCSIP